MGRKSLLGCALYLSFASSLVLHLAQSLPEISVSPCMIAPIRSGNFQSSIPDPTSSLSLSNITAPVNNTTLTEWSVSCNGATFSRPSPASYASCQDAFSFIPAGGIIQTFGDRASGDEHIPLPQTYMSGKRVLSIELSRVDCVN